MELQPGWYKVKINGKWDCAYYDGAGFATIMLDDFPTYYESEELDQIGDRIEFPTD